jgi:hypothetical protein
VDSEPGVHHFGLDFGFSQLAACEFDLKCEARTGIAARLSGCLAAFQNPLCVIELPLRVTQDGHTTLSCERSIKETYRTGDSRRTCHVAGQVSPTGVHSRNRMAGCLSTGD